MASVRVNVALVGFEAFDSGDRQAVTDAVGVMQSIWAAVGLQVIVARFVVPTRLVGRLIAPYGGAEAQAITERVAGPAGAVDMFVVRTFGPGWGIAREGAGPCDKQRKGMTGVVVSIMGNTTAQNGTTFAHELGHYLGLPHCRCNDPACTTNLMRGGGCPAGSNTAITPAQAAQAKTHCFVTP
jgi:hypothetical protein